MNNCNIIFLSLLLQFICLTIKAQQKTAAIPQVDPTANGKVYIITQKKADYTIDSARYAVFIPEGVSNVNGVLIHQHGCTMEGRGMATAYDVQYQAFAKKWQLAIVGPDLYAKNNCHDWKNPGSGSADALLTTLNQVATLAKIPSLKNAPWLLWGHSGGGYWSQAMMVAYPERVMALFSYSPGLNASFNYPKAAMQIPVMIRYAGPEGDACCWESAVRTFDELRKGDGMVSIALTRYQNHNYSFVRYMAIPFFEAVMQQRMPEKSVSGFTAMRPVDRSKAWLGDTASLNIYPERYYPGDKRSASWLPDSITAVKWREYIITGTITDRTAPPAPYGPKLLRRHNMTVELSWKADADIESGISHFNIYKDGNLINRFPSSGIYQGFDTNGDNAFPMTVAPLQMEITVAANDTGKIEISTVNHFGLESVRVLCPR